MQQDLQALVARFVADNELESDIEHRMLDLVSGVGELSKELLLIATDYGRYPTNLTAMKGSWRDELGDVAFSLICLANSTNTNLEDALKGSLRKYQARIDDRNEAGSGH